MSFVSSNKMLPSFVRRTIRHARSHRWQSTSTSISTSHNSLALPVINLDDFRAAARGSAAESAFLRQVKQAASGHGFFYLSGHGIEQPLFHQTFSHLKWFFSLREAKKMQLHHSNTGNFRGYIGLFEQGDYGVDESSKSRLGENHGEREAHRALMDFKEVFHIGPTLNPTHPHYHELLFSENVWPEVDVHLDEDEVRGFRAGISTYYKSVEEVSDEMFEVFARCLGLESGYFKGLTDVGMNSMNMIHYPPISALPLAHQLDMDRQLGIGEHTDFECFTLLAQHGVEEPCLDIWVNEEWVPVQPIPDTFVVNIGDMLSRWSNDEFQSTIHRARNHSSRDRYSIAFFRAPNFDTTLEGICNNGASKYDPVFAGEHLLQRISKANEPVLQS